MLQGSLIVFLGFYLHFGADSLVLRGGREIVPSDLVVTGVITNTDLFNTVVAYQSDIPCRTTVCNNNGNCTYAFQSAQFCSCDIGYCGETCSDVNPEPVAFVGLVRVNTSFGRLTFSGGWCTTLTSGDTIRLVHGTCANPRAIMLDLGSPTLNGTQAVFTFNATNLTKPFVTCYKHSLASSYLTISDAPSTVPCPSGYSLCLPTGQCVSNCTANCTNNYTLAYAHTKNVCLKSLGPLGNKTATAIMGCTGCGIWFNDFGNLWDGDVTTFGHCNGNGECANWITLPADYVLWGFEFYARPGFYYRGQDFSVLLFNSSIAPGVNDTYATLQGKSFMEVVNYDWIKTTVPPQYDLSNSGVVVRTVLVYRPSWAQEMMNYCELLLYGYPY